MKSAGKTAPRHGERVAILADSQLFASVCAFYMIYCSVQFPAEIQSLLPDQTAQMRVIPFDFANLPDIVPPAPPDILHIFPAGWPVPWDTGQGRQSVPAGADVLHL